MKRVLLAVCAVTLILIIGSVSLTPQAAPLNQSTQAPSASWGIGALLRVKSSVAFSWLRSAPSVSAQVIDTAPRGDYLVVANATAQWDGVQYWWQIRRGNTLGWVEESSLELVIAAPTATATTVSSTTTPAPSATATTVRTPSAPASWAVGATLHLKAGVPFAWLRISPAPTAKTVDTASSGETLVVVATPPQADSLQQLWWLVRRSNGSVLGYVEQDSLEAFTPTAVPSLTPTVVVTVASPTPATPATWAVGASVRIKTTVAFSWLRLTGSPSGQVVDTAVKGETLVVVSATPVTDSYQQLWWLVRRTSGSAIGYVEQTSLEAATSSATATPVATQSGGSNATPVASPSATPAPAAWAVGSIRTVKQGLAFAWLRTAPASTAGVQLTLYPGYLVLVQSATPTWDGTQWWWQVWFPARNSIGWLEQNSLN